MLLDIGGLPGPEGGEGYFGVREVINNGTINNQQEALASLLSGTGTIVDYTTPVVNMVDSGSNGHLGDDDWFGVAFQKHRSFWSVDNLSLVAKGTIDIPSAGTYTFLVNSDDGFRLAIDGQYIGSYEDGRPPGDSFMATYLTAGKHAIQLTFHEGGGGAEVELLAAPGEKHAYDDTFQLVGAPGIVPAGVPVGEMVGPWHVKEAAYRNYQNINNISQASALLNVTNPSMAVIVEYDSATVNFKDPKDPGLEGEFGSASRAPFGIDNKSPYAVYYGDGNDQMFALRATGTLRITTAGDYSFGVRSDDGFAFRIQGAVFTDVHGAGTLNTARDTMLFANGTPDSNTIGHVHLEAGDYPVVFEYFECFGGACVELSGTEGFKSRWDNTFTLLGGTPRPSSVVPAGLQLVESLPRVVRQTPADPSIAPVESLQLDFGTPMDATSFSPAEDIVSFTGPNGPVAVTGFNWVHDSTLEVTFEPQFVAGSSYEMVIGPEILDIEGNPMDQDRDGIPGEIPEDQYTARFAIAGAWVSGHTPSGSVVGPIDAVRLAFQASMDQMGFSLEEDIVSLTGPAGPFAATGYRWLDHGHALEIAFEPQVTLGAYELVVGPKILDLWHNAMDQDGDLIIGEGAEDCYTASFAITGPKVVEHTPSGYVTAPVQKMQFSFDQPMEDISFSPEDDVVSFTGPNGPIAINDHRWIDPQTLELSFDQQNTAGEYELVLGPQILNLAGIAMDQDEDFNVAEEPDDQYTATFTRMFVSTITEDTVWGPIDPPIILPSTVTVASGATLTIEAGSTLKFSGGARLVVNGKLDIRGTVDSPVILTSYRDDEAGGDTNGDGSATSPVAGDWGGIDVNSSATANLENVEVRYASKAIDADAQYANVTLRNTVLRDGGFGIYVYSPYVEIDAENVLVANNAQTGVFVRADSRHVFRNSTIVGNGFQGSGWYGAGIHLGGANLTLDNCIVAFNRVGLHHEGDPPALVVRNSDFYNPDGQNVYWEYGDPGEPQLDQDGNLTADPLFVNRSGRNYELAAGSPAIDAGRGIQVPQQDLLGRSRYDDQGMPNVGNGYPSFVDIGAFERQANTSRGDLAVTRVSDPMPEVVHAGDSVTIEWTVSNIGAAEYTGTWQDLVYLSSDPYLGGDQLLATVDHAGPLAVNASDAESVAVTVAAASGPKYILVHARATSALQDPVTINNLGVASRVLAIDVPLLQVGSALTATAGPGEWDYYRFEAEPGRTVLFSLDGSGGALGVYLRRELPPTLSQYDVAGAIANESDQQVRLLDPLLGTYYVGVYAASLPSNSASYTLAAALTALGIRAVTPDRVGNAGTATIKIVGDSFQADSQVHLVAPDGAILEGSKAFQDSTTLFATFDLAAAGAAPGLYDVVVTNPGPETVARYDAVTVVAGGTLGFRANLSMPAVTRPGRVIDVRIDYTNTGSADISSPHLRLSGSAADCAWRFPGSDEWSIGSEFKVMALGSDGFPSILRPGQTESLVVQLLVPFRPEAVTVAVSSVGAVPTDGSNSAIEWDRLKAEMCPEWLGAEGWDAVWGNVVRQVGETWRDYRAMLNDSVVYLGQFGETEHAVEDLLGFEFRQADGLSPVRYLASSVDTAVQSPGLPLQFLRSYAQPISRRHELGPLGRGWAHSWQVALQIAEDGTVRIIDATGTPRVFVFDPRKGYVAQGDDGAVLSRTQDGSFRLSEPNGLLKVFGPDGLLSYFEDPSGNRITAGYASGRLTSLTHSNGSQLLLEYTAAGRISQIIDPRGLGDGDDVATTFEYDASGEYLLQVTAPGNRVTRYVYETAGTPQQRHALLSVEHPDGRHDYFAYDDYGRLTRTGKDGGAEAVTYSYPSTGTVVAEDAAGRQTTFSFGRKGDVARVRDTLGNVITTRYDADQQPVGLTGPSGQTYRYSYDARGNVIGVEDPTAHSAAFTYDPVFNKLTSVTDFRGNTTRYAYDAAGNVVSITYQDGTSESFTYDGDGNVLTWTNRRGDSVLYGYNSHGQVTSKDYSTTPGVIDYQYAYNASGDLVSTTDASGTTTWSYDPDAGWLTRIDYPGGRFFTFEYDGAGRRTRRIDQAGNTENYFYDAAGRLDRMTDTTGGLLVDYDYDAAGQMIRKTLGNGVYTTYEYDAGARLTHLVNYDPAGGILSRFDYTYNEDGLRTSMTTLDGTYTYGYDPLGQLTRVTYPHGRTVQYVYDAAGNRLEVIDDGVSTPYTSNAMNQYVAVGGTTYVYDADGNLTAKTEDGVTTTYTYDAENRLIGVSTLTDTWTYTYDALGNRVASTHNGTAKSFIVDPSGYGNVAAEYDGAGNLVARYSHGQGLLSRHDLAGTLCYTFDAIGSTSELTDDAGAVANGYAYDPFGTPLRETEIVPNAFRYVGEHGVTTEPNGLGFMRARFYDPSAARFISEDPIGLASDDLNPYRYASNRPIDAVDPQGTKHKCEQHWEHVIHQYVEIDDAIRLDFYPDPKVWNPFKEYPGTYYMKDLKTGETIPIGKGPYQAFMWQAYFEERNCWGAADLFMQFCAWDDDPPNPPDPDDQEQDEDTTDTKTSYTPEDKFGPAGYDTPSTPEGSEVRYVPAGQVMQYRVEFWNKEDAPVPTQDAIIMDQLDPNVFDLSTLEFKRIGFLDWDVELAGGQVIDTRIDCRPGMDIAVEVKAGLGMEVPGFANNADITENTLVWWFHAIDPETGEWPEDPTAGFLPPYNPDTGYEIGWVEFAVDPVEGLASGTELANLAYVEFDFAGDIYDHPAPKVDPDVEPAEPAPWVNTIDAGVPESNVLPLPATSSQAAFLVQWTGEDEENGSGLAGYDIYVSTDGGEDVRWLEDITGTSAVFPGDLGHTYAFYSIATDNVGHRETTPLTPDAQITLLLPNQPPVAVIGGPYFGEEGSAVVFDASGSSDPDGDPLQYRWDFDNDGTWDTQYSLEPTAPHTWSDDHSGTVAVEVYDGELTASATASVTVNNVAPTLDGATFPIPENSPEGTPVGTVTGTDPGDDTLSYSIVGTTPFSIEPATGLITVGPGAQLDFEMTPSLTLEVQVADDDWGTGTAQVTVNLLNQPSISGAVFVDVNQNGLYEANEPGIDGVDIELLDGSGNLLSTTTTSNGRFYLDDLDPGTYRVHEVQPTGVDDGAEIVGSEGGTRPANDTMQLTLARVDAADYLFAELGQEVTNGDTATIGFWQNKHGQDLIARGGTALAAWLTANFENVFGDTFADGVGDDGFEVAAFFKERLFRQKSDKSAGPAKVDAQFMAVALATYFTSNDLAGDVAAGYGFNVTDTGIGTKVVNVADKGTAFDVADDTDLTIMQLLLATNCLTDEPDDLLGFAHIYDRDGNGVIDSQEAALRAMANDVYSMINEQGDG